MQEAVEQISVIEDELNNKIDRLVDLRRGVEETISTIGDQRLETVLRYRYIDGMTLEQIAVQMSYSYDHVLHLHGWALKKMTCNNRFSVLK